MTERQTSSKRPYLIRALHEWMSDNGLTPHIVVDAQREAVDVPREHVQNGKIILNVSFHATQALHLGNEELSFAARFGGQARTVSVPVGAVLGIYARETGQGMIFSDDGLTDTADSSEGTATGGDDGQSTRAHLKIVK